jgi:transcriptional regulator with XRE-family HTH domain
MRERQVMGTATRAVGDHLREWRQRRRMSQLDLALEANISARHLSFVETGRSAPSREMVLHLAEQLDIPLRERNLLLVSAGFAPIFPERSLDDPALQAARRAMDLVLKGHEPYPAVAVDRHWTLVAANAAIPPLLAGVSPELLQPPVNVLRLTLHAQGLAPRILNLSEWRAHLLARLRHQVDLTADPVLVELLRELSEMPGPRAESRPVPRVDAAEIVVPMRLRTDAGILDLFSTTTVFGTPVDITLSELAIESFFPANSATADALRALCPQT